VALPLLGAIPFVGKLLEKIFDRALPDKSKSNEAQARINEAEVSGAPTSHLRLWRSFVGWVMGLAVAWEILFRPVIVTYWPDAMLPPSMLKEVLSLLMAMMGFA
jgi:hypothetical protein